MKLLLLLLGTLVAAAAGGAQPGYLFSYFTGNGEDGLHLAASTDALHWTPLRNGASFLRPEAGMDKLMRDPCIVQARGRYWMVWTTGWHERGFGCASSADLVHWSPQRYVAAMAQEPGAQNCWAPEIFYDAPRDRFLVFWATSIPGRFPKSKPQNGQYDHRIYYVETADFESFSPAKLLYDHDFSVIDATIQPADGRYVMFLKDESEKPAQKNLRIAWADKPEGPWEPPSEPITGKYWAEGPTALCIDGVWHVYFDKYADHGYGLVTSPDLKHWTDRSADLSMPRDLRHGTVFRVPADLFSVLKKPAP